MSKEQKYTIEQAMAVGYNLEPMYCKFCGAIDITYLPSVHDALCEYCGKWQIEDDPAYQEETK